MSIVALALRLSAVRALQAATLVASSRIYDSAVLPIDQMASNTPEPFISISTEDESSRPAGRDLNSGDRMIDLVVEIAIAKTVTLPGEEGAAIAVVDTDANLELTLAVLARQIAACLFGRGGGLWGDAFRAFAASIEEANSRRGVPVENGQRFAARQLVYRVKALAEPPFGPVESNTPFAKFFAAAEGDAPLAPTASIIRRAIEGDPVGWPELYTQTAVDAGYTEEEAVKIGIAPEGGLPSVPVASIETYPIGVVLDADLAATALPPEET